MPSVYLINVGANTSHRGRAKSPIFPDGTWVYVPFFKPEPESSLRYCRNALRFIRSDATLFPHADPDWDGLTYGDDCSAPRAAALGGVKPGDTLLFWGLLWGNSGSDWTTFTGQAGWFLFGALRVEEIAEPGQPLERVSAANRDRAGKNAHFMRSGNVLPQSERVFLGSRRSSARFERPVDLEVNRRDGLVFRAFAAANGCLLTHSGGPAWRSSLRSCRAIWNLDDVDAKGRAAVVRDAIRGRNEYDLFG